MQKNQHVQTAVTPRSRIPAFLLLTATLACAALTSLNARAVALSDTPVATVRSSSVKPNIMFLMDTSTSMSFTHIPDGVEGDSNILRVGYVSPQCNSLYYTPDSSIPYNLPKKSDGSTLPQPSFTSAPYNYYIDYPSHDYPTNTTARVVNLSNAFQAWDTSSRRNVSGGSDTPQGAYYWVYTAASGGTPKLNFASSACQDFIPASNVTSFTATGGGNWSRVAIAGAADQARFARWYAYYRTRMALIKSSLSLALNENDPIMNDRYRLGLISMNPYPVDADGNITNSSTVQSSKYEPLRPFDATQRVRWFDKLFSQRPEGYSPAREGLARVGRHYSNQTDSINTGMGIESNLFEYGCQQNFTIMTTDGYWNVQNETRGPLNRDGTARIGQMDGLKTGPDGDSPKPMWDGALSETEAITDQSNEYRSTPCNGGFFARTETKSQVRITQYQEQVNQVSAHDERWLRASIQRTATTARYTLSTHRWFKTQVQRNRDTNQINQSTLRYTERQYQERGGGTIVNQSRTLQETQRTRQYQQTDVQQKRLRYQWNLSTSRKTQEQFRFTATQKQVLRLEYWQTQTVRQNWITQTQVKETSSTQYATYYQQWGTAWRYEVLVNERYQPADAATCTAAGGNCRIRDVVRDTVVSSIPATASAMDSCASTGPSPANSYTTTNCEPGRRYFDGNGTAVGSSPIEYAIVGCNGGTVNKTTTSCRTVNVTDTAVDVCTVGTNNTTKKVTTACVTTTIKNQEPVNTCTPPTRAAPDWITSTCGNNDLTSSPLAYGTCTPIATKVAPDYKTVSCSYTYRTSASATSNTNTAPLTSPQVNFGGTAAGAGYAVLAANCPGTKTNTHSVIQCDTTSSYAVKTTVKIAPNSGSATTGTSTCVDVAPTASVPTQTLCDSKINVASVAPVTACTYSGSNVDNIGSAPDYVVTRCIDTKTGPTAQNSDCSSLNAAASSTNNYTATTCTKTTISDAAYSNATCNGEASPGAGPTYYFNTCYTTAPVVTYLTSACSPYTAGSGNSWTTRTCVNTDNTVGVAWGSCVGVTPSAGNNNLSVVCNPATSAWADVPSCSPQSPNAGNQYIEIQCQTRVITGTQLNCSTSPPGTCVVTINTADTPVNNCTFSPTAGTITNSTANSVTRVNTNAAGTQFYCTTRTTGPTPVATCTEPAAASGNNWTRTTCAPTTIVTDVVTPATCTNGATSNGTAPNYFHTRCYNVPVSVSGVPQTDVPAATCTPRTEADGVTVTTCRQETTTNVPVASCLNANAGVIAPTGPDFIESDCRYTVDNPYVESCAITPATSTNNYTAVIACPTPTTEGPTAVASCVGVAQTASVGNNWKTITCDSDPTYTPTDAFVQTCTAGLNTTTGVTRTCNPQNIAMRPVQACSFGLGTTAATAANSWKATVCELTSLSTYDSGTGTVVYRPVDSCVTQAATAGNGWVNMDCQRNTTPAVGLDIRTSCTPQTADASNQWTHVDCAPVNGNQLQVQGTTTRYFNTKSGAQLVTQTRNTLLQSAWTNVGSCVSPNTTVIVPPTGRPNASTSPTPAEILTQVPTAAAAAPELVGCTSWSTADGQPACVNRTSLSDGGSTSSLADIAQYYYVTDLRPNGVSTVDTIVPKRTTIEADRATHQHMTTFVIGLGVSGQLNFRDDYKTASSGDFQRIRDDADPFNWPVWPAPANSFTARVPPVSMDPTTGNYNYPGLYDDPRSIDDFWHTAVNGRGQYFNGGEPKKVIDGLGAALVAIDAENGASSGATTSTLSPVVGDNKAFVASFVTKDWTGELDARNIDIATGAVQTTPVWTASQQLGQRVGASCDNRKIYYMKASATDKRGNFAKNTRACDTAMAPTGSNLGDELTGTELAYFTNQASNITQYVQPIYNPSAAQISAANTAANLVNYLRGQKGLEGYAASDQTPTKVFRTRSGSLGTIVSSQPAYVKPPSRDYSDPGYYEFRAAQKDRKSMVYVAANDGMLHAFDSSTGAEDWAWVPTLVMSQMYQLADVTYDHKFLTDGTPVTGDFYDATIATPVWKTMLVAGLNNGGRGYYALDITDPANPKGMWEFKGSASCAGNPVGQTSDCDLGKTFGRPIITKLGNGTWVVLVTSGYNNTAGDGRGHLYVLNAANGQIIKKITTTGTGLKDINTYVGNIATNNMVQRVYGGDLDGNIWRFDVNDIYMPAGSEATLVGRATDPTGAAQPITTRVELAELGGKTMIFVGTGQLLSAADLIITTPSPVQSVYGFADTAIGSATDGVNADVAYPPGDPARTLRAVLKPLELVSSTANGVTTRTIRCASASTAVCATELGWRIDLPDPGERVNIDMSTALGTLVFASNVPSNEQACSVGGTSWLNFVSMTTGEAVASSTGSRVSVPFSNSLTVGLGLIILPSGQVVAIGRGADSSVNRQNVPTSTPGPEGRRVSWREITQ